MNIEKLLKDVIQDKSKGNKVAICLDGDEVVIIQNATLAIIPSSENLLDVTKFSKYDESIIRGFRTLGADAEVAHYTGNIREIGKVKAKELKSANKSCWVNPKLLDVFEYGKKNCTAELCITDTHKPIRVVEQGKVIGIVMPLRAPKEG